MADTEHDVDHCDYCGKAVPADVPMVESNDGCYCGPVCAEQGAAACSTSDVVADLTA